MMKIFGFILVICMFEMFNCQTYGIQPISASCLADFQRAALAAHNRFRALHINTPALTLNTTLNNVAQAYSLTIARNQNLVHSKNGYGENLYYSGNTRLQNCSTYADQSVSAWYNEISLYNYAKPGFSLGTGHFTQVVWRSSTQVGCGLNINYQRHSSGFNFYNAYVSCNYSPAGNFNSVTSFTANVQPRRS